MITKKLLISLECVSLKTRAFFEMILGNLNGNNPNTNGGNYLYNLNAFFPW